MASEWEMAMAAELGMEMGVMGMEAACFPTSTPNLFGAAVGSATGSLPPAYFCGMPPNDAAAALRVDDLLDLSNAHELFPPASATNSAADNSVFPAAEPFSGDSGSSSDLHPSLPRSFADDFYIPSEEAAELEWLSKFVDDSYSDIPYPPSSSAAASVAVDAVAPSAGGVADNSSSAPGRGARSKRSRGGVGAGPSAGWHSLVPPPPQSSPSSSSSSSSEFPCSKPMKPVGLIRGKKPTAGGAGGEVGEEGGVRRCTHCASEKTPQWRTGPLGPKTLCNACGVRYKSGRLVPEYRPAASPTFVLARHSNSHRKVMELRRQKELLILRGHHDGASSSASAAAGASAGRHGHEHLFRNYGVC